MVLLQNSAAGGGGPVGAGWEHGSAQTGLNLLPWVGAHHWGLCLQAVGRLHGASTRSSVVGGFYVWDIADVVLPLGGDDRARKGGVGM